MISKLWKPTKHRRFDYTPRYYDEVKEDISSRKAQIIHSINQTEEPTLEQVSLTRGVFQQQRSTKTSGTTKKRIIIAIILFCIFGYLYIGNYSLLVLLSLPFLIKFKRSLR
ncbi:MAG: hypothetical protein AB8B61_10600 [Cyclobacteriaceae bacterium]